MICRSPSVLPIPDRISAEPNKKSRMLRQNYPRRKECEPYQHINGQQISNVTRRKMSRGIGAETSSPIEFKLRFICYWCIDIRMTLPSMSNTLVSLSAAHVNEAIDVVEFTASYIHSSDGSAVFNYLPLAGYECSLIR